MKLYIPALGDVLRLTKDWNFTLYAEYRNATLFEFLGFELPPGWQGCYPPVHRPAMLPAGTALSVDRIYIRRGAGDFDSLSFNLVGKKRAYVKGGGKPPSRVRFWAKLSDVNTIEFEGSQDLL